MERAEDCALSSIFLLLSQLTHLLANCSVCTSKFAGNFPLIPCTTICLSARYTYALVLRPDLFPFVFVYCLLLVTFF